VDFLLQQPKRGQIEKELCAAGTVVAGVDEVGKGCLAGPVFAGAAILDYQKVFSLSVKDKHKIRDSKKLSAAQRAEVLPLIQELAVSHAVGQASVAEINKLGLQPATFLAMKRALASLTHSFDLLLIDGKQKIPGTNFLQQAVIKGDDLCFCIAAASIIAKLTRDAHMQTLAVSYPGYGFENHVGYATARHRQALQDLGVTDIHRRNFAPVALRLGEHAAE
jgi:ribonuclease HII